MPKNLVAASRHVSELGRRECIDELLNFRAIPLDFNRAFLDGQTLDRLRHILMAAYLRTIRRG